MTKPHPQKFKDYTRAYFNGSGQLAPERRDELILTYTPLIKYIATRLASRLPPSIAVDDLISSGIIGLIDAIDKFDLAKNVQFKTYAEFRIKGAMLDELRSLDWVPRSVRGKISQLENAYNSTEQRLGRAATDDEMATAMGLSLEEFYKLLDETKEVSFMDIELLKQNSPEMRGSSLDDLMEGFTFIRRGRMLRYPIACQHINAAPAGAMGAALEGKGLYPPEERHPGGKAE